MTAPFSLPVSTVDGNSSTKVIFKSFGCSVMGITINQKRKGWRKGAGIVIVIGVDVLLFTRRANEKKKKKKFFFKRHYQNYDVLELLFPQ